MKYSLGIWTAMGLWLVGSVGPGRALADKDAANGDVAPARKADKMTQTAPAARPQTEYVYRTIKQDKLKIYLSFPPGWKATDRRAGIVFFFGGGWRKGSPEQFRVQADYLAQRGMIAARADYRVKTRHGTTPMDALVDVKSAVRWLRANAGKLGLDPDRICGAGGSAGGHLAACTVLVGGYEAKGHDRSVSSAVNALLLFNPPMKIDADRARIFGFTAKAAKELSPIDHLRKGLPATLLLYGTSDGMIAEGKAYMARAKALGNRVEFYTAEGAGHGFFNRAPWKKRTLHRADEFLASIGYVQGPPTLKLTTARPRRKE